MFHTSAEKEVVRLIKESVTYVAHDPKKEEKEWAAAKMDPGKVAEYTLPDGKKLKVWHLSTLISLVQSIINKSSRATARSRAFPCTRDPL